MLFRWPSTLVAVRYLRTGREPLLDVGVQRGQQMHSHGESLQGDESFTPETLGPYPDFVNSH